MNQLQDNGATILPPEVEEARANKEVCGPFYDADGSSHTYKHKWEWVWKNNVWTKDARCSTCGKQRENGAMS